MRKLATIQRIKSLEPIENADQIEKALVLGWNVVVKKGDFKVNDFVVYCEIDSLLPNKPEFEFLKPRGMRIRTVRLRGQISQGICFPLSILPKDLEIVEDMDCTDILNIEKYEPPIPACLRGTTKGRFPSFIPKTDETRVQVLEEVLERHKGEICYISEKVDGSSCTLYVKDNIFGVCSRNLELLEDDSNSFWKIVRELDIKNKLLSVGKNIAIQGELIGEGVQGNKLNLKGTTIKFFNAFDIDLYQYYSFNDFIELITNTLELETVPIITTNYVLENDINKIVNMSIIKSNICNNVWAEGIVIRPINEKQDPDLGRLSFKAINPEFLLKNNE
jgi:RNA ligase (TIGR02306 family)